MEGPEDDTRGYGQYCPISRALEVLGERWSMLIVRDLLCGATRFNELARCNPRLSRTLLAKRLRQLERAGIVDHLGDQYLLTPAGKDLEPIVFGVGEWGARWQFDQPREEELDPELLMWWVHTRLDFSGLDATRSTLEFRFSDARQRFWIVHDTQGASICTAEPGFEVDALIESDLSTMYQVWMGQLDLRSATRSGRTTVSGRPAVVRRLPAIFLLSPIADRVAAVNAPRGARGAAR